MTDIETQNKWLKRTTIGVIGVSGMVGVILAALINGLHEIEQSEIQPGAQEPMFLNIPIEAVAASAAISAVVLLGTAVYRSKVIKS